MAYALQAIFIFFLLIYNKREKCLVKWKRKSARLRTHLVRVPIPGSINTGQLLFSGKITMVS